MSDRKQGRRSAKAAEATKYQIMKVASDMFCELGYERVSLRNISEGAGVSHSLIRHHFGSKEQIWYAISDALHEYMHTYVLKLIEDIDPSLPSNVRLYRFSMRLMAHMLIVQKPIQFTADVVRQEDKLIDYMIDHHGKIEPLFIQLFDSFNSDHPDHEVDMMEQKWMLISFAHSAVSLKPFVKEIWPQSEGDIDQCLVHHWELFNKLMASSYMIPKDQMIHTTDLKSLLLPMAACWEDDNCCEECSELEEA